MTDFHQRGITKPAYSPRHRLILLGGGVAAGLSLLYVVDPAQSPISLCPFHSLTGLNCPACGATRAVHQLLHAQFITALHLNALLVLGLPVFAWIAWRIVKTTLAGQPWRGLKFSPLQIALMCFLLLSFTIVRNLPFAPYNWLSP